MSDFKKYLKNHVTLAVHWDEILKDRLKYELLGESNSFWESVEAAYGCQNRLTMTLRYFDVKRFDFYEEFGIKVMDAAFVMDAAGRVLTDSRFFLYMIVLGGKSLLEADGYHVVIKRGKRVPLIMQDSLH